VHSGGAERLGGRDPAAARAGINEIADQNIRTETLRSIEEIRASLERAAGRRRLLERTR
jgi:hypothetical protein